MTVLALENAMADSLGNTRARPAAPANGLSGPELPYRALVADDQPDVLTALRLLLKVQGFETVAASSPEGVLRALDEQDFDVLLMDLNYTRDTTSGKEGLDLLERLKGMDQAPPVVVMTAWGSIELAVEAMRRGARDFVPKPWENQRLVATLREHAEARRQGALSRQPDAAADGAADEIRIAGQVQRKLFPHKTPSLRTLECSAYCRQAGPVGGDYYDFLDLGPGRLGLVLADVSGKGVAAALLMANLQASLRSRGPYAWNDLPGVIQAVNQLFCESTERERYATLFFGCYDDSRRTLRYANCGHYPPVVVRAGEEVTRLDSTATVLGLFDRVEVAVGQVELEPGDLLAIFSDGVIEARGRSGEEFGEERLVRLLRRHQGREISEIPPALSDSLMSYAAFGQEDDLTLVVARAV
jgi:sigma-B regulation protein RsbU (phosphoserine phosphatase)